MGFDLLLLILIGFLIPFLSEFLLCRFTEKKMDKKACAYLSLCLFRSGGKNIYQYGQGNFHRSCYDGLYYYRCFSPCFIFTCRAY